MRGELVVRAVAGIGEVSPGDDLVTVLADGELADGDVVVVTSKIVSKSEGRLTEESKDTALAAETARVVARRGPTTIARTRHGLVMAAAGIDASNVAAGRLVLLPLDPDASARTLRAGLRERYGVNVAVVVSDTAGRAWRVGQTDIAVGAAGLLVADDHAGRTDGYGNELAVTMPAVADEIAGAAELATGKLSGSPVSVVRGLAHLVLAPDADGPGAAALVRPEREDMFGLGAREAVLAALHGAPGPGFGAPAGARDVTVALRALLPAGTQLEDRPPGLLVLLPELGERARGRAEATLSAAALAHGWVAGSDPAGRPTVRPAGP